MKSHGWKRRRLRGSAPASADTRRYVDLTDHTSKVHHMGPAHPCYPKSRARTDLPESSTPTLKESRCCWITDSLRSNLTVALSCRTQPLINWLRADSDCIWETVRWSRLCDSGRSFSLYGSTILLAGWKGYPWYWKNMDNFENDRWCWQGSMLMRLAYFCD